MEYLSTPPPMPFRFPFRFRFRFPFPSWPGLSRPPTLRRRQPAAPPPNEGQETRITQQMQNPAPPAKVAPNQSRSGTMPVTLSIKNAPDDVVHRLRLRAEQHHRSLQGELLAIIEEAVRPSHPRDPYEVLDEVRRLGLNTPSESTAIIRADRDSH